MVAHYVDKILSVVRHGMAWTYAKSAYHNEGSIEPVLGAGELHDKVHADCFERGVGDRQVVELAVR
jgi:hypothetical protein